MMTTDMQADTLEEMREKMTKTVAVLKKEYAALRAGRANPQVLDRVMVDYYNTPTPRYPRWPTSVRRNRACS